MIAKVTEYSYRIVHKKPKKQKAPRGAFDSAAKAARGGKRKVQPSRQGSKLSERLVVAGFENAPRQ